LIEVMVTLGVVGITSGIMWYVLYTGMVLFAKNSAINMAHQEARIAMMNMEQNIHAAVSVPYLASTSAFTPLTGSAANGPAAGISFQLWDAGPFEVAATAAAGQSNIQITMNGFTAAANERLIIPAYVVEQNITSVSGSTLTLAAPFPTAVQTSLGSPAVAVNVQCFITHRAGYIVQNNQLCYYANIANSTYKVLASNITTATPFSLPTTPAGAPYSRFVSAINLSTSDAAYSNLNFKAANMFLNALEPCRAQLCIYQ